MADWKRAVARVYSCISGGERRQFCGTAFMVSDRHLLTCWHVIRNVQEEALYIRDAISCGGGELPVRLIASKQDVDVALLELKEVIEEDAERISLPLEEDCPVVKDKTVELAGYASEDRPRDYFKEITGQYEGRYSLYAITVAVGKGMSGAPVLYQGKLVGISRLQSDKRTYLIPLSDFQDLLNQHVFSKKGQVRDPLDPTNTPEKKDFSNFTPEFIGREEEKELFKDFLKKDKQLLIFRGERGIGKTALLEELYDSARKNKHLGAYCHCVGSADEETSILKGIRNQIDADVTRDISLYFENIFTLFDNLLKKIENRGVQENSDKLYNELWEAFRHAISSLSERIDDHIQIIFFFDETEKLSSGIREWLRQRVEYLITINGVFVVFAIQQDIDKRIIWKNSIIILEKTISEFTEDERKKYLQENLQEREKDNDLINSISSVTGNPFALSLFCTVQKSKEIRRIIRRVKNDKNSSLNFLLNMINELLQQILNEYDCKKIVQQAAVLRSFDEYIFDIVLKKECTENPCDNFENCSKECYLDKIKKSLIVERVRMMVLGKIYKYHDLIRESLYRELPNNPYVNRRKLHQVFLEYYKKQYDEVSIDNSVFSDADKLFLSEKSDLILLEIIYHQLVIDEKKGLKFACDEFKLARQSFKLSRCTRIISELENFPSKPSVDQVVDFLNGKLAITKGHYGNAIEKFKQVLKKPDLLIGKDKFNFEARVALGESFFLQGNHPDSLKELSKALERVEGREEEFSKISADAHWIIGRIYRSQGNMRSAAEHLRRCIKLSIQIRRDYFAGYGLCTLGEVYQIQGEYERAEEALEDSLNKLGEERSQEILGRSLHILGRVHQFQGQWQKAEPHLKRSLEIRQELTKDKPQHSLGYAYWGFGWFYLFQCNASAALSSLEKSENIFKTLNEKDGIARTYRLQAEVCLMQGDNEQAAELLHKAIAIQKEKKGNYELGLLHLGLTRYHIAMENWQKAVETNEKARMLCEGAGDRWAQVKSDILQCQIDMHLSQYDDLESRISKANIEVENFPNLMFELELVRGEYAVTTDRLNDGVGAYKKAYSKAKEFYHPDEGNANYVAKAIYGQVQSLPQEKKEYLTNSLPEIMSVAAE